MRTRILGLFVLALVMTALPSCNSSADETDSSATAPPDYKPPAKAAEPKPAPKPAPAAATPASRPTNTQVVIETNMGTMVVRLDDQRTPITVANFLQYVDDKFYDNTIIHRVERNFVIQGGGFDTTLREKETRPPIINEGKKGRQNTRGTIAMARTSEPNSATCQFYINLKHNATLDGGYCAFGEVIEGMDVVDKIGAVPTENRGGAFTAIPIEQVVIRSIRRK
ncbi:MAG TPA: peptidylprolyl isomerase [Phycisphaerae bacterium]|nr:peptidylprolyl isomerase [Phycisphaerae bacterium]HRR86361.1 peptidylprolyl isomerase [Phycisphaerae bacterium]